MLKMDQDVLVIEVVQTLTESYLFQCFQLILVSDRAYIWLGLAHFLSCKLL